MPLNKSVLQTYRKIATGITPHFSLPPFIVHAPKDQIRVNCMSVQEVVRTGKQRTCRIFAWEEYSDM